ncbi:MAG: xylanase [Muribaculaceae bacterium]|nr:xylanase [Muribaculaceae bacterium]
MCACAWLPTQSAATEAPHSEAVIDLGVTYQTIVDFGASDAWLGDYIGRYFSDAMKERAAKLLFSQAFNRGGNPEGIGLSNWRVNLGGGSAEQGNESKIDDPYRRAESFLASNGVDYDWSKAAGQQYFMRKAKEYGVENILFFCNSAPVQYTKSGTACNSDGAWGSNLKSDCYDDFAEYLATVTEHFTEAGYHISYVSPVNEPEYDWGGGQEGSPWLNEEITRLARAIDASFTNHNLSTQILIPEAGAWYFLTGWTLQWGGRACDQIEAFFNPSRATYIGNLKHVAPAVAGHDYWTFTTNNGLTSDRSRARDVAARYGIDLFQTEWSMLEDAPQPSTGFPEGGYSTATYMDIALFMGKLIHCDMVYGNMASWSYWTAFAQERYGQKNRFYLLRVNANGDSGNESYGDLRNGGTILDNRNLWVLGNYSRFVRPGYKRVSLTGADDINALMGSAYVSPDGKQLVAVFVNMDQAPHTVSLNLTGSALGIASLKKYTTSATNALTWDRNLPAEYHGEAIEVPERSVVTMVMELAGETNRCDINADGVVDIDDVNLVINAVLGKLDNADMLARADVTGSGAVDVDDLNIIINTLLGKS